MRDRWTDLWMLVWVAGLMAWCFNLDGQVKDISCRLAKMETLATSSEPLKECKP